MNHFGYNSISFHSFPLQFNMTNEQDFRKNNNNQEQSLHFSFLSKPLKDFFAVTELIFAGKDKLIISPSTFYCSLHIHFVS